MFIAPVDWGAAAFHLVTPQIADAEALLLAVGIIGATVMPHAIYLHSGLTQARVPAHDDNERRIVLRFSNREVVIALSVAGLVNIAMVMMASGAFHAGHPEVAEIETAYHTLTPLLGAGAAGVFLVSLIASGVSASTVGTMAGQMIMQGFIGFRIPIWLRRLVTMVPAFVVVALGANATKCSGHQPGRALARAAVANDLADHLHQSRRHYGAICEQQADACRGGRRHGHGARSEYRFDCADFGLSRRGIKFSRRYPGLLERRIEARPMPGRASTHLHGLQVFCGRLAGLAVHHDFEGNALTFP